MSKTLKLRAWIIAEGWIGEITNLHFGDGAYVYNPNTKETRYYLLAEFESMEWIGLLDKNGKEIWEGDIVLINHPHDRTGDFTNARGEVFWWDEEGGWYHSNEAERPPKRMWKHVEVIGNVYENPELLPAHRQEAR